MTIEAEVAKKILAQIDVDEVLANLDYTKIAAAVEKGIIAALKDYYWQDAIHSLFDSGSLETELEKTILAVLKKMQATAKKVD